MAGDVSHSSSGSKFAHMSALIILQYSKNGQIRGFHAKPLLSSHVNDCACVIQRARRLVDFIRQLIGNNDTALRSFPGNWRQLFTIKDEPLERGDHVNCRKQQQQTKQQTSRKLTRRRRRKHGVSNLLSEKSCCSSAAALSARRRSERRR